MFIRSLTLATLFAVAGSVLAAEGDTPLAQELGKTRPLIVIVTSAADPTLVNLKKALDVPANHEAFVQRNMVLYTVVGSIGQRDGKYLEQQTTMALIRQLKLGASAQGRVILVGKDGEKKLEHEGPIDPKDIFSTIDQMPMAEKEAAAPAPPAPEPEAKPGKADKTTKGTKAAAPALDD